MRQKSMYFFVSRSGVVQPAQENRRALAWGMYGPQPRDEDYRNDL